MPRLKYLSQIHIDKLSSGQNDGNFESRFDAPKLMHRFTEQQVEEVMDVAQLTKSK